MEPVVKGEKRNWRPLEKMFNEVPGRYDLLNRIITLGLDERWRKMAVRECLAGNPGSALDLCTGTGDLVLRMARNVNGATTIQALDYSAPMLELAKRKAFGKGLGRIGFIHGDAADMPFQVVSQGFCGRPRWNDFRAQESLPLPGCLCKELLYTGGNPGYADGCGLQAGQSQSAFRRSSWTYNCGEINEWF